VHNSQALVPLCTLQQVYEQSRCLSNLVVPLEYGFSDAERLLIGRKVCALMLSKIGSDLEVRRSIKSVSLQPTCHRNCAHCCAFRVVNSRACACATVGALLCAVGLRYTERVLPAALAP
jgi:hypothetical protein